MARRKKTVARKKTAVGGPPPPPPPPPPKPEPSSKPKKKKEKKSTRTYLKIKAIFKCSGDKCSRKWSSVHSWKRDEQIFCDLCDDKAEILDSKDEMCELANYYCGTPSCGGNHWQSNHDGGIGRAENCGICGASVAPSGTQNRFGRHFWFGCTSQDCGVSWEDFSLTPQRTQRCGKCGSRGDVIGTRKVKRNVENMGKRGTGGGRHGGMAHNWENCDMCQDLKGQGKAESCLKYWKVQCKVEKLAEGIYSYTCWG